jgi:hypothetical protein
MGLKASSVSPLIEDEEPIQDFEEVANGEEEEVEDGAERVLQLTDQHRRERMTELSLPNDLRRLVSTTKLTRNLGFLVSKRA